MTFSEVLKPRFAGQMTEGELQFCQAARHILAQALNGYVPFAEAMASLSSAIQLIRENAAVVDAAWDRGLDSRFAIHQHDRRSSVSEDEIRFLRDMDGLVDFAVRNGLNFLFVARAMAHDLGELASNHWNLENLKKNFVLPQSKGWAERNQLPVADLDDLEAYSK